MADACASFVMDEDAFRAFYDRTARGLWAYLVRVTNDRQIADDLLQETYYRFVRANATHESESHRRNSLYRIATNLARDVRRKAVAGPVQILSGDDIERAPASVRPGAADRISDLTTAMSQLRPRDRAMLWLAYAEGASHGEIADVLGLRQSSLKTLLFRARHRLSALMEGVPGAKKR